MSQANVRSIDAIRDFKLALISFAEDARVALGAMEMEIRQVQNWLERDQLTFWKAQVKRSHEEIAEKRTELHRRQLSQINSDAVSDSDQKEALRKAQRRLQFSEEMVERVKKWIPILEHALAEYHSQSQPLGDRLSGGLLSSIAVLDRMITVLDEYVAMQAPAAPVLPPTSGPATAAATPAGSASSGEPGAAAAGTAETSAAPSPSEPEESAAAETIGAGPVEATGESRS
jgi:hypothetical protein